LDQVFFEEFTKQSDVDLVQNEIEESILKESIQDIDDERNIEEILNQSRREYFEHMYNNYKLV